MALSDKYTLAQLRLLVRRDLADPTARWWPDAELNQYINDWQHTLQSQFEFVWGSATITSTNTSSLTATGTTVQLTSVATNIMRLDAIYCSTNTDTSTWRLSPRSLLDLDMIQRDWRLILPSPGVPPDISYQLDAFSVSIFPPLFGTATFVFEYPVLTTLTADTQAMAIPAWTRYSCLAYCAWKAYARFGVNQNLGKAARRKRAWDRQQKLIRRFWDAYMPEHTENLRPGRRWAGKILRAKPQWPVWR